MASDQASYCSSFCAVASDWPKGIEVEYCRSCNFPFSQLESEFTHNDLNHKACFAFQLLICQYRLLSFFSPIRSSWLRLESRSITGNPSVDFVIS